jgi:hypothetical protein
LASPAERPPQQAAWEPRREQKQGGDPSYRGLGSISSRREELFSLSMLTPTILPGTLSPRGNKYKCLAEAHRQRA